MQNNEMTKALNELKKVLAEDGADDNVETFSLEKSVTPAQLVVAAVGRVVRAVTYPIIANDYPDMSLRELNLLASICQANHEARVGLPAIDGGTPIIDTADGLRLIPGASQAFWAEEQYDETYASLERRGLIKLTKTTGKRLVPNQKSTKGRIAQLTEAGFDLIDAMAGNIGKSLSVLENPVTKQELKEFGGVA